MRYTEELRIRVSREHLAFLDAAAGESKISRSEAARKMFALAYLLAKSEDIEVETPVGLKSIRSIIFENLESTLNKAATEDPDFAKMIFADLRL